MMGFTANQWAILALVLVLGWLLGMLSRAGGARWRAAYEEERVARQTADARLAASSERIAELERKPASRPIGAATAASIGAAAAGNCDDLALIRGVGRDREMRLNEAGIYNYHQLAVLDDAEMAATETRLGLPTGTITREEWREQAALLRDRGVDAHHARYRI